jgi:hypothetical protein
MSENEVSIEAGRQRELQQRRAAEALERIHREAFDRPLSDPVQEWRDWHNARAAEREAETRRRHRQENRERALEQDVSELQQLLADALRLVDQLLEEAEANGASKGKRRKPTRSEPEVVTLPSGFLGPRHHPEMPNVRVTQPIITRRR